jgi:hypothetical protein
MGLLKSISDYFVGPSGEEAAAVRPGRNEACWCGSGRKYKKCHLQEDEKKQAKRFRANCGTS